MTARAAATAGRLGADELEELLEVTRRLASPYDLNAMLAAVVDAARKVLHAERGSVFLYDATSNELVLKVATDLAPIRVPADRGIVGQCAQTRRLINVPDCYADPRFNPGGGPQERLPHALHAEPAADQPRGRADRRAADPEPQRRQLRQARRACGLRTGRAMRSRAASRADDRDAAPDREARPGNRRRARDPDVGAAEGDAAGGGLRRRRALPADRPDRRRPVRLRQAARRSPVPAARRRHRARHRTGALRHPGSRHDPRRPATGCRARRGLHARQQPARRRPARRPFRHRVPGTARHDDPPRELPRRRPGPAAALPRGDRVDRLARPVHVSDGRTAADPPRAGARPGARARRRAGPDFRRDLRVREPGRRALRRGSRRRRDPATSTTGR